MRAAIGAGRVFFDELASKPEDNIDYRLGDECTTMQYTQLRQEEGAGSMQDRGQDYLKQPLQQTHVSTSTRSHLRQRTNFLAETVEKLMYSSLVSWKLDCQQWYLFTIKASVTD